MNPREHARAVPVRSLTDWEQPAGSALWRIGRQMADGFREWLVDPRAVREPAFVRLITGEPHPFGNFALLSDRADLRGVERAVEPLCSCRVPVVVIVTCEAGAEVAAYLARCGFVADKMPAMAVDIAALPDTPLPGGCTWERVTQASAGEEWVSGFAAGYELPPAVARVFGPVDRPIDRSPGARTQHFMIRQGDRIVATAMLHLWGGVAGVYCISTLPSERRKGLGACATAGVLREAAARGYGVGVLQSSETGYPVYRRLGFRDCGNLGLYLRMPG